MLQVSQISKSFNYNSILKNVTFSQNKGESISLMGKNGAGKTTLLRIIARLMTCDNGQIFFNDKNLLGNNYNIRKKILYIGHEVSMYSSLTAVENLKIALTLRGLKSKISNIDLFLEKFGLLNQLSNPISVYSKGMLQRLKLCLSDIVDCDFIMIDEPFSGLDHEGIEVASSLIENWKKNKKTILMVLHNQEYAKTFSDRILKIDSGVLTSE